MISSTSSVGNTFPIDPQKKQQAIGLKGAGIAIAQKLLKDRVLLSADKKVYSVALIKPEIVASFCSSNSQEHHGYLIEGELTGKGMLFFNTMEVYEGDLVDGLPHGYGTLKWVEKDDLFMSKGRFAKAEFVGEHELYANDKLWFIGVSTWKEIHYGKWFMPEYTMETTKDRPNFAKITYFNGTVYEGEHLNQEPHGKGTITTVSEMPLAHALQTGDPHMNMSGKNIVKIVEEGAFTHRLLNGPGTRTAYVNGHFSTLVEGTFLHNRLEGPARLTQNDGKVTNVTYKQDIAIEYYALTARALSNLRATEATYGFQDPLGKEARAQRLRLVAISRRVDDAKKKWMNFNQMVSTQLLQRQYEENLESLLNELEPVSTPKKQTAKKEKGKQPKGKEPVKQPPASSIASSSSSSSSSAPPPAEDRSPISGFHPPVKLHERVRRWATMSISDIKAIDTYAHLTDEEVRRQQEFHHLPNIYLLLDPSNRNKYFAETDRGVSMLAEMERKDDSGETVVEYGYVSLGFDKSKVRNPGKYKKEAIKDGMWQKVSLENPLAVYHVKFTPSTDATQFFANPEIVPVNNNTYGEIEQTRNDELPVVLDNGAVQFTYGKTSRPYTLKIHPFTQNQ